MKFSYTTLLDYPLADSLEHIKKADELGYYACYAADETWHKDLWLLYAAAADKTKNVRFGPTSRVSTSASRRSSARRSPPSTSSRAGAQRA